MGSFEANATDTSYSTQWHICPESESNITGTCKKKDGNSNRKCFLPQPNLIRMSSDWGIIGGVTYAFPLENEGKICQ